MEEKQIMRRLPRRKLRPEAVLDNDLRWIFENGRDMFGYFHQRLSDEELRERLREPWKIHGERVTRDFMRRHAAGQRPTCWWWYNVPEPRLIAPDPDGKFLQSWEERDSYQLLLDRSLLIKHGLLTDEEQKAIEIEAAETKRMYEEMKKERAKEDDPPDSKVN
jgi:hypothetical protein